MEQPSFPTLDDAAAYCGAEGVIYKLPQEFLKEFNDRFLRTIPAEKAAQEIEEQKLAKLLIEDGAHKVDGLGQKMGSVPVREFFRWQQAQPGCWQDDQFISEFFRDNRHLMAPGYRLKPAATRKGGRWNS